MKVYKVQTQQGFLPPVFETEGEAREYALAFCTFRGIKFRIVAGSLKAKA